MKIVLTNLADGRKVEFEGSFMLFSGLLYCDNEGDSHY